MDDASNIRIIEDAFRTDGNESEHNILGSIRTTLAKTPIGALFASRQASPQDEYHDSTTTLTQTVTTSGSSGSADSTSTSPTDSTSSSSHRFSFSDAKRMIKDMAPAGLRSRSGSLAGVIPASLSRRSPSTTRSRAHTISTASVSPSDSDYNSWEHTPPLTPDSLSASSTAGTEDSLHHSLHHLHCPQSGLTKLYDDYTMRSRQESERIRAGKQPARPVCYDTLIADISSEPAPAPTNTSTSALVTTDDEDDWVGLEETIELSLRERRASDCQSPNAGEFSKSHESWAALHRGKMPPLLEEREYRRWRRWHLALDRHLQKRRIQRTLSFLRVSKELSELHAEEWNRRDWLEYYKACGDQTSAQLVQEDLALISLYRPDPYYPPVKHDLSWVLKVSRSSACLRELSPVPDVC